MRTLLRSFILICVMSMNCYPLILDAFDGIERAKRVQKIVTYTYSCPEDEIWSSIFLLCESRFGIALFDKSNGLLATKWVAELYPSKELPGDFLTKMKSYGAPLDHYESHWSGIRYNFLIFVMQIAEDKTRVQVTAQIQGYHYRHKQWRWWNSNGSLENHFFEDFEKEIPCSPDTLKTASSSA